MGQRWGRIKMVKSQCRHCGAYVVSLERHQKTEKCRALQVKKEMESDSWKDIWDDDDKDVRFDLDDDSTYGERLNAGFNALDN
jgi:hypothetical protein